MKKRLISMLLLVVMVLGMLPATALAASSEEEALGEVNIYNGEQKLSYLSINSRIRELIYTYFNYVDSNGRTKEIPAYCVNPNTKGVPQTVAPGESIKYVCSGIVATAAGSIGGLTGASVALPQEIADAIGDVGFFASIPLWLVTLLGSLFITVLAFIMILTVYGRFFKIYMYAALSPVALASFAGEGTSHFGKAFLRSYVGVCMEGAVIVLACIIFSAFSSSGTPVVDSSASVVTQVWSYLGEVIFNLLVLVGLVKSADHIAKEMLGL